METSDGIPLDQDSIDLSKNQVTARGPLGIVAAVIMVGFGSLAALSHGVDSITGWRLALSAYIAASIALPVSAALVLMIYLVLR